MVEDEFDPDVEARAMCLEAAIWFFDKTGGEPDDIGAVTNVAEFFLHYLMNDQSNEFDPKSAPIKCVRGQ